MTTPKTQKTASAPKAEVTPEGRFQAAVTELKAAGDAFAKSVQERDGMDIYVPTDSSSTAKFTAGRLIHVSFA